MQVKDFEKHCSAAKSAGYEVYILQTPTCDLKVYISSLSHQSQTVCSSFAFIFIMKFSFILHHAFIHKNINSTGNESTACFSEKSFIFLFYVYSVTNIFFFFFFFFSYWRNEMYTRERLKRSKKWVVAGKRLRTATPCSVLRYALRGCVVAWLRGCVPQCTLHGWMLWRIII